MSIHRQNKRRDFFSVSANKRSEDICYLKVSSEDGGWPVESCSVFYETLERRLYILCNGKIRCIIVNSKSNAYQWVLKGGKYR